MSQKIPVLFLGYPGDAAAFIAGKRSIGSRGVCALYSDIRRKPDVRGIGGNGNRVDPALHLPAVGFHIEIPERLIVQTDAYRPALPCLQEYLGKALQLLLGAEHVPVLAGYIYLGNLRAVPRSCIGYGEGDPVLSRMDVGIEKGRVTQAMAEGVADRNICGTVVPVTDVQSLPVLGGPFLTGKIGAGGGILQL